MTSIVELRDNGTPVSYIRTRVRYDAWGDPYVKPSLFQELTTDFLGTRVLFHDGRTDRPWVQWKLVEGGPISFPDGRESRGWKP